MTITQTRPPLDRATLAGFLLAHAGMRKEFARLAGAARVTADSRRAALIEDQIVLVTETLHHHHTVEDEEMWPKLRARAPHAVVELDKLEAEHEDVDPLIERAADTTLTLAEREDALQQLHDLLNAHLDREESVAVPLILEHLTRDEWEALEIRMQRTLDRRRLPLLYGWLASCGSPAELAAALNGVPALARILFKWFWWPSYQRRFRMLYETAAPELLLEHKS